MTWWFTCELCDREYKGPANWPKACGYCICYPKEVKTNKERFVYFTKIKIKELKDD